MAWVVDTCIALDIALGDKSHGEESLRLLEKKAGAGLVVCPVTFIELAPQFEGNTAELEQFLELSGLEFNHNWTYEDTLKSAEGFARYIRLKRAGQVSKRPVADILIGAYAMRFSGLLTRNPDDFKPYFPGLTLLSPKG